MGQHGPAWAAVAAAAARGIVIIIIFTPRLLLTLAAPVIFVNECECCTYA
jgi:uncharacterized membrane protein YhhN